jgi:hypothetical protein
LEVQVPLEPKLLELDEESRPDGRGARDLLKMLKSVVLDSLIHMKAIAQICSFPLVANSWKLKSSSF